MPQEPLDSSVVNLAQSISKAETGGSKTPYTQSGPSGEYGAYQYTPTTWAGDSQKYLGQTIPLTSATPAQQDEVAYNKIKDLGSQGHTPAQIASIWNSGKADPTGNVGVNKFGVAYDTPAYVKKVQSYYNQNQSAQSSASAGAPVTPLGSPSTSSPDSGAPVTALNIPAGMDTGAQTGGTSTVGSAGQTVIPGSTLDSNLARVPGDLLSAGNAILPAIDDVFNDITGKSKKTALQQLGDVGTTALTVGTIAQPELGLARLGLEGGAGIAARVGANAAIGAGFGASGALGAGDTNGAQIGQKALLGAGVGGLLGGAGEVLGGVANKFGAPTPESRLTEQTQRLKTLDKAYKENSNAALGTNPIKTLLTTTADDGKPLIAGLKTTQGKVNASALTNETGTGTIDNAIETHSEAASNLVKSLQGPGVPLTDFEAAIKQDLQSDPTIRGTLTLPKALATVDSKLESARMSYGDTLPWTAIDEIRAGMNKIYDPTERDVARVIGDTSRTLLYNGDSTNVALKSAMQNEAELIRARNFVQKLHGTTVPGGKLGRYFAQAIGSGIGGAAGSVAGPFGTAAGIPIGAYSADRIEQMMQSHYFNPVGRGAARATSKFLKGHLVGAAKVGILRNLSQ